MKIIFKPFAILLSALFLMASCLGDSESDDITYYGDAAITSFTLGTLDRTMHTLSSAGEDSTYTASVTGSDYKMYIDQAQRSIYNADSLPQGTDVSRVLCTVGSKNSGLVTIKDVDSDTLRYYSSTDSIDFSSEREFRVYSTDGMSFRAYKVKLNVHQEDPDSFRWNAIMTGAGNPFASARGMKAVVYNGKVYVFASDGTSTSVYTTPVSGAQTWAQLSAKDASGVAMTLDADAYKSATVFGNLIYTLTGGSTVVSADGEQWIPGTSVNTASGAAQPVLLAGATQRKLYAMGADGSLLSTSVNGGVAWETESLLGDASRLPVQSVSLAVLPMGTDEESERVVIAGNPADDTFTADSVAMVWNKIEEYADDSDSHGWMPCSDDSGKPLPRLANISMMKYGKVLIAFGGRGLGTSKAEAFADIYVSEDNGLTWQTGTDYVLPEGFANGGSDVFAATVDADNCLWIICGGNGAVWRGRLNRLGWADQQTSFTE